MKHSDYNELAADFRLKIYNLVWRGKVCTDQKPMDFIHTYHCFHQIKHLAENALIELNNLQARVETKPKP